MNAKSEVLIPIHGEYAYDEAPMKKPTKSPINAEKNPNTGPIITPVSAEKKVLNENCTAPSGNDKRLITILSAAKIAMYAKRCVPRFFQIEPKQRRCQ